MFQNFPKFISVTTTVTFEYFFEGNSLSSAEKKEEKIFRNLSLSLLPQFSNISSREILYLRQRKKGKKKRRKKSHRYTRLSSKPSRRIKQEPFLSTSGHVQSNDQRSGNVAKNHGPSVTLAYFSTGIQMVLAPIQHLSSITIKQPLYIRVR